MYDVTISNEMEMYGTEKTTFKVGQTLRAIRISFVRQGIEIETCEDTYQLSEDAASFLCIRKAQPHYRTLASSGGTALHIRSHESVVYWDTDKLAFVPAPSRIVLYYWSLDRREGKGQTLRFTTADTKTNGEFDSKYFPQLRFETSKVTTLVEG